MFYPPIAEFLVLAGVMVSLAVVQQHGRLKRNSAIGIRTRHALASGEKWASAHVAASPYTVAMAVLSVVFGIVLLTFQLGGYPEGVGHILALSGYVVILPVALVAWRPSCVRAGARDRWSDAAPCAESAPGARPLRNGSRLDCSRSDVVGSGHVSGDLPLGCLQYGHESRRQREAKRFHRGR